MAMVIEAVEEKSHCFLLQRTRLVDFIYIVFFVCLFCVWCFKTGFSQCSPGCPGSYSVDQAGIKLRDLPVSAS